jgi:hypothetical protein
MLITFSKQEFENLIKQGIKIHTIRQDRHNRWKTGMKIHFWMRNPRNVKGNPYPFGLGKVDDVKPIRLYFICNGFTVADSGMITSPAKLEQLAINDGFSDWEEMKQWFDCNEFYGKLITWTACEWF